LSLTRPKLERQYLASNDDLQAAADSWQGPIAFDTEFIRTRTFFPIPGLYQLATDRYSYLIDPITIDAWAPLIARLDASTPVVMHSCSEDLELLNHHVSVQPGALFDTQVAYGFITDKYSASYAALVNHYTGLELDKGATRSNWLKRPLSDAQVHYAHEDVTWLLQIRSRMLEQLEELGRGDWCEEEMRKVTTYNTQDPMQYYLNLGSGWRLKNTLCAVGASSRRGPKTFRATRWLAMMYCSRSRTRSTSMMRCSAITCLHRCDDVMPTICWTPMRRDWMTQRICSLLLNLSAVAKTNS